MSDNQNIDVRHRLMNLSVQKPANHILEDNNESIISYNTADDILNSNTEKKNCTNPEASLTTADDESSNDEDYDSYEPKIPYRQKKITSREHSVKNSIDQDIPAKKIRRHSRKKGSGCIDPRLNFTKNVKVFGMNNNDTAEDLTDSAAATIIRTSSSKNALIHNSSALEFLSRSLGTVDRIDERDARIRHRHKHV
ncbi:hypothetical protein GJ496_009573 [Pomphorhynchus laevis]|nr:hypothetical protein GJ496_009573 [Pomphorhynchus laevis]